MLRVILSEQRVTKPTLDKVAGTYDHRDLHPVLSLDLEAVLSLAPLGQLGLEFLLLSFSYHPFLFDSHKLFYSVCKEYRANWLLLPCLTTTR